MHLASDSLWRRSCTFHDNAGANCTKTGEELGSFAPSIHYFEDCGESRHHLFYLLGGLCKAGDEQLHRGDTPANCVLHDCHDSFILADA